jgi:hypothetical protein
MDMVPIVASIGSEGPTFGKLVFDSLAPICFLLCLLMGLLPRTVLPQRLLWILVASAAFWLEGTSDGDQANATMTVITIVIAAFVYMVWRTNTERKRIPAGESEVPRGLWTLNLVCAYLFVLGLLWAWTIGDRPLSFPSDQVLPEIAVQIVIIVFASVYVAAVYRARSTANRETVPEDVDVVR